MLLREQAIMILKQYTNGEQVFFDYSLPYHLIPAHIKNDFYFSSEIGLAEESLMDIVRYTIHYFYPNARIFKQTSTRTIFFLDFVNFDKLINDLNSLQKEFDIEQLNNSDFKDNLNKLNEIREKENLLIAKAEEILKLKEAIDSKLIEYAKEFKDFEY